KRCPNAALPGSKYCGVPAHQALVGKEPEEIAAPVAEDEAPAEADAEAEEPEVAVAVLEAQPVPSDESTATDGEDEGPAEAAGGAGRWASSRGSSPSTLAADGRRPEQAQQTDQTPRWNRRAQAPCRHRGRGGTRPRRARGARARQRGAGTAASATAGAADRPGDRRIRRHDPEPLAGAGDLGPADHGLPHAPGPGKDDHAVALGRRGRSDRG